MRKKRHIFIRNSIQFKMLNLFLPIILISTISITTLSFTSSKKEVTSLTDVSTENKLEALSEKMQHEFTAHSRLAQSISTLYKVKGNELLKEEYRGMLEETLTLNKNTFGMGIFLEPYKYNENEKAFGPYVYREGDNISYSSDYEAPDYNYHGEIWYKKGKEAGEGSVGWSKPYYDEFMKKTLITASVPIFSNGSFLGVVTADYDLTTIQDLITKDEFSKSGYLFLV